MKKTITYCDICKAEDAKTYWFTVDRRMDPAGSMNDVQEDSDLCGDCAGKLLLWATKTHLQAQAVVNEIQRRIATAKRKAAAA